MKPSTQLTYGKVVMRIDARVVAVWWSGCGPICRRLRGLKRRLRYKDIAFASVGEGVGVNFQHEDHFRGGRALGNDLGRRVSEDVGRLTGLGDIKRAPAEKAFFCYAE